MTTVEWRQARGATGLLRTFTDAAVLESSDVHVAQRLTALAKEPDETVALAVAMAVRALRNGSVCVDLRSVEQQVGVDGLPWPDVDAWLAAVRASTLATTPPTLRVDGDLLYLDRYWLEEQQVADDVHTMIAVKPEKVSPNIDRLFPKGFEEQRAAAKVALSQGLTVLTGGPGTGKTTTVARLLALLASGTRLRIALAAPTGKAAARLQEAVQLEVGKLDKADQEALSGMHATTLHRLLGSRPDTSARFRHNRGNRLPHDVIVVDETSMVSLTMMARLLEAVRPDARLILVGDPDQLASVEAGAVLADLVDGLGESKLAALKTPHRFGESIGELASAIRAGETDAVIELLRAGGEHIEWVDTDRPSEHLRKVVVPQALRLREAAILGNAEVALQTLDEHRLLCAHRRGPYGIRYLEPAGRAVAGRRHGRADLVRVVCRATGAGDVERLRVEAVQRRHGRHGGARRRVARGDCRHRTVGVRDEPAVGRGHVARDDDPQEPRQPGRRGHGALAARGFAAADARAVLHGGHTGEGENPGDRDGGIRSCRGREAGRTGERTREATTPRKWPGRGIGRAQGQG